MAKIWRIDNGETTEVKDVFIGKTDIPAVDAITLQMFVLCMKTAEDFIRLSNFADKLPIIEQKESKLRRYSLDDRAYKSNIIGYQSSSVHEREIYNCELYFDPNDRIYEYTFKPSFLMLLSLECSSMIKNLSIDIYHPNILSIEIIGGQTIMPMEDGFNIKVFKDFTRFTLKGNMWFPAESGISDLKLIDNIIIKSLKPLSFPIRYSASYKFAELTVRLRDAVLQKNKIVKDGKYWQNIRMNNGECWKSEMVKYC